MTIAKDTVVAINYILKDDEGKIIDQSRDEPLVYLHGYENLVPGLEKALEGLSAGTKTQAKITPQDGYGDYNPELKFNVPLAQFAKGAPPTGAVVHLRGGGGQQMMAQVLGSNDKEVMLDGNHPLAGMNLNFEVTIVDIRAAEPEEIAHGHVHGPGGHHH